MSPSSFSLQTTGTQSEVEPITVEIVSTDISALCRRKSRGARSSGVTDNGLHLDLAPQPGAILGQDLAIYDLGFSLQDNTILERSAITFW
jgi:hypothetical protein